MELFYILIYSLEVIAFLSTMLKFLTQSRCKWHVVNILLDYKVERIITFTFFNQSQTFYIRKAWVQAATFLATVAEVESSAIKFCNHQNCIV